MNWIPEPATERQLTYLKRLGHVPNQPLSRLDAAQLIRELQDRQAAELQAHSQGLLERQPEQLRLKVERAKLVGGGMVSSELVQAISERQEFWSDTCREVVQMHSTSKRVLEFYQRYGCRFQVPTHQQVQSILDALDTAAVGWDRDHPELFYQTLELNYPDLVKRL